ncbi:MAG TPA: hypothetical protein VKZ73_00605 [Microbacterium sp.]|nr:hypothetical protein [Microbacterium sp.]
MDSKKMFRVIALWLPLGFVALCVIAQAASLPFLPTEIVSKWSLAGEPSDWRPAWEGPVVSLAMGIVTTVPLYCCGALVAKRQEHRLFAGLVWLIVMIGLPVITVIVVGQVWTMHLRLGEVAAATAAAAVATAIAAGSVLPPLPRTTRDEIDPRQWSFATQARRFAPQATLIVAMCACVGSVAIALAALGAAWWILSTVLVIAALSSTQLITLARIDARGVTVRSPLGVPRVTIPLRDIESFERIAIDLLADLGRIGWNTRIGAPQEGVAIRAGEGLRIRRASGIDFLLATDDAASAERVLGAQLAAERNAGH